MSAESRLSCGRPASWGSGMSRRSWSARAGYNTSYLVRAGRASMKPIVEIVDRGRGPQLSNSRITVQDLVPYFQEKYTYQQIMEMMPVLTVEDIQTVERYVQDNHDAVMEQDRRIRERQAARRKPPEV